MAVGERVGEVWGFVVFVAVWGSVWGVGDFRFQLELFILFSGIVFLSQDVTFAVSKSTLVSHHFSVSYCHHTSAQSSAELMPIYHVQVADGRGVNRRSRLELGSLRTRLVCRRWRKGEGLRQRRILFSLLARPRLAGFRLVPRRQLRRGLLPTVVVVVVVVVSV